MIKAELEARYLGGMVGSALGDAIGELAFRYPDRKTLAEVVGRLDELRYTDDTAMSVALATSIVQRGSLDGQHLGETFRRSFQLEPWRGYASGPPTIFAMVQSLRISYVDAAQSLFGGVGSFGNGAAMRIAPMGLFFYDSVDLYAQACASAEVTHAHPIGKDGAAVQAHAVAQAVKLDPHNEFPPVGFIRGLFESAQTPEIREKMELVERFITENVSPELAVSKLGRSVAVHESMPFAIYAFLRHPKSFEDCVFCAVLHGGDRDTLGSMAGAVSGAHLGVEAIPAEWRHKLENQDMIEELALALLREKRTQ